jgi:hypothetical protein
MGTYRSPWMDRDLDSLADITRTFFEKECAPNEERWNQQQHGDREVWNKAGDQGPLCISIPEEYGGGGGTFAHGSRRLPSTRRTRSSPSSRSTACWKPARPSSTVLTSGFASASGRAWTSSAPSP